MTRLRDVGHPLAVEPANVGSVQAVIVDLENGLQYGGADRRSEGFVAGAVA